MLVTRFSLSQNLISNKLWAIFHIYLSCFQNIPTIIKTFLSPTGATGPRFLRPWKENSIPKLLKLGHLRPNLLEKSPIAGQNGLPEGWK